MTLTDPLVLAFDGKYMAWTLQRGRECFYDENRVMRLWGTPEEARAWARANLGLDPLDVLPEPQRSQSKTTFDENMKKPRQGKLL
mgnify:CR=1 FL=1